MPKRIVNHNTRETAADEASKKALLTGLPLVHFNDSCCDSVAELRSIILKARRLADDHAEQSRAAFAAKQAAKAMRDEEMQAEIEDFIEGFNQPTYRGMRVNGVRVATWSSQHCWSGL
jgi:hypothetical protein